MLASVAIVALLSLVFHLRARPHVLDAFRSYETPIPPLTELALSPWLLPLANGAAIAASLGALVLPLRRSQRAAGVGAGLVISSAALVFAVLAAFMPIFNP